MKEFWVLSYHFKGFIGFFKRYFKSEFEIHKWLDKIEKECNVEVVVDDVYVVDFTITED